jgi:hypothetical protein
MQSVRSTFAWATFYLRERWIYKWGFMQHRVVGFSSFSSSSSDTSQKETFRLL